MHSALDFKFFLYVFVGFGLSSILIMGIIVYNVNKILVETGAYDRRFVFEDERPNDFHIWSRDPEVMPVLATVQARITAMGPDSTHLIQTSFNDSCFTFVWLKFSSLAVIKKYQVEVSSLKELTPQPIRTELSGSEVAFTQCQLNKGTPYLVKLTASGDSPGLHESAVRVMWTTHQVPPPPAAPIILSVTQTTVTLVLPSVTLNDGPLTAIEVRVKPVKDYSQGTHSKSFHETPPPPRSKRSIQVSRSSGAQVAPSLNPETRPSASQEQPRFLNEMLPQRSSGQDVSSGQTLSQMSSDQELPQVSSDKELSPQFSGTDILESSGQRRQTSLTSGVSVPVNLVLPIEEIPHPVARMCPGEFERDVGILKTRTFGRRIKVKANTSSTLENDTGVSEQDLLNLKSKLVRMLNKKLQPSSNEILSVAALHTHISNYTRKRTIKNKKKDITLQESRGVPLIVYKHNSSNLDIITSRRFPKGSNQITDQSHQESLVGDNKDINIHGKEKNKIKNQSIRVQQSSDNRSQGNKKHLTTIFRGSSSQLDNPPQKAEPERINQSKFTDAPELLRNQSYFLLDLDGSVFLIHTFENGTAWFVHIPSSDLLKTCSQLSSEVIQRYSNTSSPEDDLLILQQLITHIKYLRKDDEFLESSNANIPALCLEVQRTESLDEFSLLCQPDAEPVTETSTNDLDVPSNSLRAALHGFQKMSVRMLGMLKQTRDFFTTGAAVRTGKKHRRVKRSLLDTRKMRSDTIRETENNLAIDPYQTLTLVNVTSGPPKMIKTGYGFFVTDHYHIRQPYFNNERLKKALLRYARYQEARDFVLYGKSMLNMTDVMVKDTNLVYLRLNKILDVNKMRRYKLYLDMFEDFLFWTQDQDKSQLGGDAVPPEAKLGLPPGVPVAHIRGGQVHNLTIGDYSNYGDVSNNPLKPGQQYEIIVVILSTVVDDTKHSWISVNITTVAGNKEYARSTLGRAVILFVAICCLVCCLVYCVLWCTPNDDRLRLPMLVDRSTKME